MALALRYRNTLIEIERTRRRALRALIAEQPGIKIFEEAVVQAETEALASVQAFRDARSAELDTPHLEAKRLSVRTTRAAVYDARHVLDSARKAAWAEPSIEAERQRINSLSSDSRREARAHCGVYWGTYLLIEAAEEVARKAPLYDGVEPKDPKFLRWVGNGAVGVQMQHGLPVRDAFGEDKRLRIGPCGTTALHKGRVGKKDLRILWLRVGSDGRTPIWARFPMILHRPLPPQGVIRAVSVHVERIGPRTQWSAHVLVSTNDSVRSQNAGTGAVAVHLGWRAMDGALRVAVWLDENGDKGELRVPEEIVERVKHPAELRSLRDRLFNIARDGLVDWITARRASLPEWFTLVAARAPEWRSPSRLAALAARWRGARFPGDDQAYTELEAWRYKDHHLWLWESSERAKSLRRRRDLYRVFAAHLSSRYEVLVLQVFDLRRVAMKPSIDTDMLSNAAARHARQIVAVGELRDTLSHAFGARGGHVVSLAPLRSTHTCHCCGSLENFDAIQYLHHACAACGTVWDQDENACANVLAAWKASPHDSATRRAPSGESRWSRLKRAKKSRSSSDDESNGSGAP